MWSWLIPFTFNMSHIKQDKDIFTSEWDGTAGRFRLAKEMRGNRAPERKKCRHLYSESRTSGVTCTRRTLLCPLQGHAKSEEPSARWRLWPGWSEFCVNDLKFPQGQSGIIHCFFLPVVMPRWISPTEVRHKETRSFAFRPQSCLARLRRTGASAWPLR